MLPHFHQATWLILRRAMATSTTLLTRQEALNKAAAAAQAQQGKYLSFYSSILGGIVKDVDLMWVPIDDHMAHRGHAVFDTAIGTPQPFSMLCSSDSLPVRNGHVYQLDQHLDRFILSAKGCHLWKEAEFPEFIRRENLKSIILDTIRHAGEKDQSVRYWLGAGTGGFGISDKECQRPSFYVLCRASGCISHPCKCVSKCCL